MSAPDLSAAVVGAVVRPRREDRDHAEVVAWRPAQLLGEHDRELRRPEELALDVHEPFGRPQRAEVALEYRPLAVPAGFVQPLGNRPHELRLAAARDGGRMPGLGSPFPVTPSQRMRKCSATSATIGSFEPHRGVMPAEPVAPWVIARVEPVAPQGREVDPAHERGLVVDDDELLVVAVEGTLSCVERQRDPRAADELLARPPNLAAVRMEEWQRGAGPGEHTNVYSLGGFREQFAQRRALLLQPEGGIEVPAREVDVRARRANRVGDPRQRLSPVQEWLDAAAGTRRERRGARPAARPPDRQPPALPCRRSRRAW